MTPMPQPPPAEQVRLILRALGWTHEVASRNLGVGRVTVSRWASGARDPGEQVLRHLRMILNLRTQLGAEVWGRIMGGIAAGETPIRLSSPGDPS